MKLRFDHQSIRLRVRKSDIEKLSLDGFVAETLPFPQASLTYRLEIRQGIEAVEVSFQDNTIVVAVPTTLAMAWINSEEVGIYATIATQMEAQLLNIIIEKDFPCLH